MECDGYSSSDPNRKESCRINMALATHRCTGACGWQQMINAPSPPRAHETLTEKIGKRIAAAAQTNGMPIDDSTPLAVAALRAILEEHSDAYDCLDMLLLSGELGGLQNGERCAAYLRRLIDHAACTRHCSEG